MGFMSHTRTFLVAAVLVLAVAAVALASSALGPAAGPGNGPSEALLLLQIVLLILTGRLLGEALQRIGLPAVMGQLLTGILLGPSFFGRVAPSASEYLLSPTVAPFIGIKIIDAQNRQAAGRK